MAEEENQQEADVSEEAGADASDAAAAAAGEATGENKKSSKMLFIIIGAAVVVLGILGGGAFWFFTKDSGEEVVAEEDMAPAVPEVFYYELPEMIVNLDSGGAVSRFLQLKVVLELAREDDIMNVETKFLTPLQDDFQTYLRTLRVEDLQGSAGVYRLRETLLFRANQIVAPLQIKRILFKQILVQ